MSNKAVLFKKVSNGFIIEDESNNVQVFTTIKEAQAALPAHFDEAETKTEAKEEKTKVAPKKEKAKKSSKKKAKEVEEDDTEEVDEDDLTLDHVREALRGYAKEHGKPAAKSVIEDVAGVKKMDDIPEDKFADVILACESAPEEDDEDEDLD